MSEQMDAVESGQAGEGAKAITPVIPPTIHQIEVGPRDMITRTMTSSVLSQGSREVDRETHDAALSATTGGARRLVS